MIVASAAKSLMAAELATSVSNSRRTKVGGSALWPHAAEADTPRPATTVAAHTLDVFSETVGRDESAAQLNESADVCNDASYKPFAAGSAAVPANTMKTTPSDNYAAFVGLDWADRSHQVCLRTADSERDELNVLPQEPDAIHQWALGLQARFPGGRIAVALEQSRGPLLYALSQHAHLDLYPLNPAMVARYRSAAKTSGSKHDPLDATLICELVRVHRNWLQVLQPMSPPLRQLQLLIEARRALVEQKLALNNQLTALLKSYFPQAVQLAGDDLGAPLAAAFLRRWPTLGELQRARPINARVKLTH